MFKNGLVPKSCYFGTMVQLVQESPTPLSVLLWSYRVKLALVTSGSILMRR